MTDAPVTDVPARKPPIALLAATIFTSAFLLFLVQPMVARMVLPWFGGSAAVWTVAMLFFQLLLLLGYLYAHGVTTRLSPKAALALHAGLLLLSLATLPLAPGAAWKPVGTEDPVWRLLGLLAVTVGAPYFLLSTTAPLLQARLAAAAGPGAAPYRLYALSNLGSMLALLGYPTFVEPNLPLRLQSFGWSAGYGLFALLAVASLLLTRRAPGKETPAAPAAAGTAPAAPSPKAKKKRKPRAAAGAETGAAKSALGAGTAVLWTLLAACGTTLFLGVTNHLCQDVAAVPFLWVLPLAIYLLSFILCFDAERWYQKTLFRSALPLAVGAIGWTLIPESVGQKEAIGLLAVALFFCLMACHGELHRLRPDPTRLTAYYLAISLGGALGGLYVGLLAPRLFSDYDELPLGLVAFAALMLVVFRRDRESLLAKGRSRLAWAGSLALAFGFGFLVVYRMEATRAGNRAMRRNFYGSIQVRDRALGPFSVRAMHHGVVSHGEEILESGSAPVPTTYFARETGVGLAFRQLAERETPRHVGVVGLGVGTLAAYARPGDRFRFYEINPIVTDLARSEFRFLGTTPAAVTVVPGDGRLSLEREADQRFDVLVIDAFSGGSIPVHLLTKEAFDVYFRHLAPDGVLAVHVSNKFLDLAPVVGLAASGRGVPAAVLATAADPETRTFEATWVLMTRAPGFFETPLMKSVASAISVRPGLAPWRDDYSNLWRIVR